MASSPTRFASLSAVALRTLQLDPAQHPRGLTHLSAASGLVRVRQRLYVVADDELHLDQFDDCSSPTSSPIPGTLLALGSGSRPHRDTGVLVALDLLGQPHGHGEPGRTLRPAAQALCRPQH